MPQRLLLDRPGRTAYLALILAGSCRPAMGPVVPLDAGPVSPEQVTGWVRATEPKGHALHSFKWLFRNERSSAGGTGRVRIAAPDTLRFDARGPLGSGRMAAVVVGDDKLWAVPEEDVAQVVPDYSLLWAMFGGARLPERGATLRGIETEAVRAWQYGYGSDTVSYAVTRQGPVRLTAEVRRAGKLFGRVETKLSAEGRPVSA